LCRAWVAAREHDRPNVALSPEALAIFLEHDWPGNVRELKNLVESMVVLAPGRVIAPDDVPPELRTGTRPERTLLPVPAPNDLPDGDNGPALEFIFRSLLHLRMDVEELRRKFEEYRREHPNVPGPVSLPYPYPFERPSLAAPAGNNAVEPIYDGDEDERADDELFDDGVVLYRPGMTMQDIERQAIAAALREVRGNRRKAADMLGIGERTLYRKIKEYELA
jgi:DNA-binding NtrC family response regulator